MDGEVDIIINVDGTIELEVQGIKGSRCEEVTDVLIKELGTVEEQRFTEEYCSELPDYVEDYS